MDDSTKSDGSCAEIDAELLNLEEFKEPDREEKDQRVLMLNVIDRLETVNKNTITQARISAIHNADMRNLIGALSKCVEDNKEEYSTALWGPDRKSGVVNRTEELATMIVNRWKGFWLGIAGAGAALSLAGFIFWFYLQENLTRIYALIEKKGP